MPKSGRISRPRSGSARIDPVRSRGFRAHVPWPAVSRPQENPMRFSEVYRIPASGTFEDRLARGAPSAPPKRDRLEPARIYPEWSVGGAPATRAPARSAVVGPAPLGSSPARKPWRMRSCPMQRTHALNGRVLSGLAPNLTAQAAGRVLPTRLRGWRARWSHDGGGAGDGGWQGHAGCGGCRGEGSCAARHSPDRSARPRRSS